MKVFGLIFSISMCMFLTSCASQTGQAAIGGGLGGALGGAVGSEVGGRTGAIIGSGVGAAAGAAIATDGYNDEGYHYHQQKRYYKNKHCPPGLAMQGRC